MREPTYQDAFAALCLQATDAGRGSALFGDSVDRAREVVAPFLVGRGFPETYLEFPLAGEPFLDVTVLLGELDPGTRVDSPLAAGSEAVLGLYARERAQHPNITCGFELDCGAESVPAAAMHFQPRVHRELVRPFCEALGEPGRAGLYLAQDGRMPDGWGLSFFGMFRGRPNFPLRVCGYLRSEELTACAADPGRIGRSLEQAGMRAYDDAMLGQVAHVLSLAPTDADFQMDVWPDGSVGDTFAVDLRFDNMTAQQVRRSLADGRGAAIVRQLVDWGIADGRTRLLSDISLTRAIPVELDDGTTRPYGLTLVPGWLKVRWRAGRLSESKMYLKASAGLLRT